jgi:hypothetical protein
MRFRYCIEDVQLDFCFMFGPTSQHHGFLTVFWISSARKSEYCKAFLQEIAWIPRFAAQPFCEHIAAQTEQLDPQE